MKDLNTEKPVPTETRNMYKVLALFISLGILVGIIVGVIISVFLLPNELPQFEETRLQSQYKFINPLLECDASAGNYKYPRKTEELVAEYIDEQISNNNLTTAAVYYRDLNNGPWFGINENTLFTPASLTKVPLMIKYLKLAESDQDILSKEILVTPEMSTSYMQSFIKPEQEVDIGKEYTVDELLKRMIIYSDNTAYKTLKSKLTEDEFESIFEDFGIDVTAFDNRGSDNVVSIREYSSFFRILFNSSYLTRNNSERALEILNETKFEQGIVSGVPKELEVAHKFGERFYENTNEKQLHDCGIVYKPKSPYLVCIMTRGTDFEKLANTLRNISEIIYTSLEDLEQ